MIDAASEFFRDPAATDYWVRIRRWEHAMAEVYAALSDNHEVAAFYALAHLSAAPPESVLVHSARAAEILRQVYVEDRDHPGAMHYLVHANDAPGREGSSLDVTRKYESSAPRNPHALHMPTHIHTRLGDWPAVVRGNKLAAEAALEHPVGDKGQFIWDEFPHAVEYLIYAFLQQGRDDDAAAELKRLMEAGPLQPSFKTAFHIASTHARYALERRAWDEAAALQPREPAGLDWDRFTWPEAITWYARGLGAAHQGRAADLRIAESRLVELERLAAQASESLFAANIRVMRLEVQAWRAYMDGDTARSIGLMAEAAELEVATPKHAVTPAPTLPAFELMGDLLMTLARPNDALASYARSLQHHPRRLNSLLGAARAAAAVGDGALARNYYEQLLGIAGGGSRQTAIDEARRVLQR
jgi:tetratricopeptide (TPR) repeat protein